MKKWLIPAAVLAAVAIFSRLPHPARDIADLKPVRAIYIHMEGRTLHIETDTGDSGAGGDLSEAHEALRAEADGEIFLDTAEFLILDPEVPITGEIFPSAFDLRSAQASARSGPVPESPVSVCT